MKIEQARCISKTARDEMIAEALALAYDATVHLDRRTVIGAIAATLNSIGDPLEKIWIEDLQGRRRTYKVDEALAALGDQANFRYLWTIPASERRNSKSRWLTAATIDNIAADRATLFFALPQGLEKPFAPHLTLLRYLAQAQVLPRYGFGYARAYGKPDYFVSGYAHKGGTNLTDPAGQARPSALSSPKAANPADSADRFRYVRRQILDVFPLNVLSHVHLQQRLGDISFKEWILQNTGEESLQQVGPGCFAWQVPAQQRTSLAAQLKEFGFTMRACLSSANIVTAARIGSSVRYQG